MNLRFSLAMVLATSFLACGNGADPPGVAAGPGSGGATASGGASHSGGTKDSSSSAAAGGSSRSGTSTALGGTAHAAGTEGPDGTTGTGGATSAGGASASDHTAGAGGRSGAGGSTAPDHVTGAGGNPTSGGSKGRTGGAMGTGGAATGKGGAMGAGGGTSNGSTSAGGCSREMLQAAVDSFLAALKSGDTSGMSLTASAKYTENGTTVALGAGLWAAPLTPDLTMNLLDVTACGSFTEVIAASASHPYVLGARLAVEASTGKISAITTIVTDCDDWGFNAATYLKEAKAEQTNQAAGSGWGLVDPSDRYTREELLAGGKAYFAYWGDKSASVPWGDPCCRTEGGMVTNPDPNPRKGTPDQTTCKMGIPDQSSAPRVSDQLADVDYGMVVDFLNMPGPDSHWFRFTKSTDMRYVHTLTVCYVNGQWQCPGTQPTCK